MKTTTVMIAFMATSCGGSERPAEAPATPSAVTYAGGDGASCEQAVVIRGAANERDGVDAEYAWLRKHKSGWTMNQQGLTQCSGRPADRLHLRSADGREQDVFFDIGDFFGKL